MATLTITIPDAQVDRVKAAFAARQRIDVADITVQNVQDAIAGIVKDLVHRHESNAAEEAARAAVTDVDVT